MKRFDTKSAIHLSKVLGIFSAKYIDVQTLSDEELEEFINDMNEHFDDDRFDLNYLIKEMKSFIAAIEIHNKSEELV